MKLIKITLFTATLILGSVYAFASNFADTYGFSAQGVALGNAMTARVSDWSSVYYNMAGLGRTVNGATSSTKIKADKPETSKEKKQDKKKIYKATVPGDGAVNPGDSDSEKAYLNELSITYFRTIPMLNIDISRSDSEGNPLSTNAADDIKSSGVIILGLAVDLNLIYKMPKFISSARIGLGMGLNDDMSAAKLNDVDLRTHNFLRYGREAQKAVIIGGLGFGFLNDLFGVGVGANVSFSGEGSVLLADVNMESVPQVPNAQSKMDLSASPAIVAGIYGSPGVFFPVVKGLEIGASYRQESYMEIYPFDTAALAMDNAVSMQMIVAIMDYYSPHIITCGAAYTRWGVTMSADVEYHMWSKYKVNASNNVKYNNLPDMEDIIVYRLGAEWQMMSWVSLMGGAYFQPSFIPDAASKGDVNFLDNDKYVGSLGAKFALPRMFGFGGPVEITVAYQIQYLAERTVTKDAAFKTTYNPDYKYNGINHSFLLGLMLKL